MPPALAVVVLLLGLLMLWNALSDLRTGRMTTAFGTLSRDSRPVGFTLTIVLLAVTGAALVAVALLSWD